MAKKRRGPIPPETEKRILELLAEGKSQALVAHTCNVSTTTVKTVRDRARPAGPDVNLPAADDRRFSGKEMLRRLSLIRDQSIVLAEAAATRVASDAGANANMVGSATALGILIDKARAADAYCRLMEALPRGVPGSTKARQERYQTLLWLLASIGGRGGSGSVPAARALGVAWGIEKSAGRKNVRFEFGDAEDDDGGVGDDPAPASAAPSA
jgi:hypothetical protein